MLTAAQGDAEVVAECLSEYPAARLCQPWILPGEYDACGLWRPVSEVFRRLRADASAPAAPAWTTSHHLRPRRSRNGVSGNLHELTPLSPLTKGAFRGGAERVPGTRLGRWWLFSVQRSLNCMDKPHTEFQLSKSFRRGDPTPHDPFFFAEIWKRDLIPQNVPAISQILLLRRFSDRGVVFVLFF